MPEGNSAQAPQEAATCRKIAFFLIPNFSMIALISAIEPLRVANRMSGRELYRWLMFSTDGGPVTASSGIEVKVDCPIAEVETCRIVFVCGGVEIRRFDDRKTFSWLRRLDRYGATVGALCTGTDVLARAGLLDGHRCTIHWENLPGLAEEFPELDLTYELFEIDGKRMTCSGGTAALDLMLNLIGLDHDRDLAIAVSDQLIHERIRDSRDHQRMTLRSRLGVSHAKLLAVISQMEENQEEPLSCAELAQFVGLSTRQMERLFRKYFKRTPTRFYLELRLDRARLLLSQTTMPVLDVALACGFVSASHFSKCYREHFGRTPREERRLVH
ncbi:MAG: GlxA family transcriptional regulator [Alphaproteobacteria bacterium]|nr:GlxA family transcriptional regulator [Alphaproteobacteria bacterium]